MERDLGIDRCHRLHRGRLGDPCAVSRTWSGNILWVGAVTDTFAPLSAYCDFDDLLICDRVLQRCLALPTLGQDCISGGGYCTRGSFCVDSGVCTPLRRAGESCAPSGDSTDRSQCIPTTYCGPQTAICEPVLGEGDGCYLDVQCASLTCRDGACVPPPVCPP